MESIKIDILLKSKMSAINTIYNAIFKRTSTFMLTIVATAFVFERSVDLAADAIYDSINRGVCLIRN